ncbi:MAG: VWA domain-containing protein [Planctomycetaceae bacterium]|nr:VWA domain-containing protein [Planctomycetaceae bacterium]
MRMNFLGYPMLLLVLWLAGCDELQLHPDVPPTPTSNPISPSAESEAEVVTPVNCLTDEHGNTVKAIVRHNNAPIYNAATGIETREQASLMTKLYVFDTNNERVKVGRNPRLKGDGFCSTDDVLVTSNMQMVEFNQDTRPARQATTGFLSAEEKIRELRGEAVTPAFVEAALGESDNQTWMPVLDSKSVTIGNTTIQLLELATWTVSRDLSPDPRTVPDQQADIEKAIRQVRIVLVIDCTASTDPVWQAMTKYLREIISGNHAEEFEIEFAIVAYRDRDADSQWIHKSSEFTGDVDKLIAWIKNLRPYGGGDWEERMFEALQQGTKLLNRPENATAFKSILLVTDNAGHTDGDYPQIGDTGRSVVETCQKNGITINTLQLPYHEQFGGDREQLPAQLEALCEATHGERFKFEGAQYTQQQTALNLQRLLERAHDEAVSEAAIAEHWVQGSPAEEIRERSGLPATVFEWRLANVQRRLQGCLALDANTHLGVDRCWVAYDPQAMNLGVMIRDDELVSLIQILDQLIRQGVEKPENLQSLWVNVAAAELGEDRPLSEELRAKGLPIRDNLLGLSWAELYVLPRIQRKAWAAEVEKKFNAIAKWKQTHQHDGHGNWVVPFRLLP